MSEQKKVKKITSIALDQDIYTRLNSFAERNQMSRSQLVNTMLKDFFDASDSLFPEIFDNVKSANIDEILTKGFTTMDTQLQEILALLEKEKGGKNDKKVS